MATVQNIWLLFEGENCEGERLLGWTHSKPTLVQLRRALPHLTHKQIDTLHKEGYVDRPRYMDFYKLEKKAKGIY